MPPPPSRTLQLTPLGIRATDHIPPAQQARRQALDTLTDMQVLAARCAYGQRGLHPGHAERALVAGRAWYQNGRRTVPAVLAAAQVLFPGCTLYPQPGDRRSAYVVARDVLRAADDATTAVTV